MEATIGILTISDRAFTGVYEDESGPAVVQTLKNIISSEWIPVRSLVPDEINSIEGELIRLVDEEACCLVITTGGTGPSARDVTPEATEMVCDRMMPGYGELMRNISLQYVPTAILSRQTAGLRGNSLILNLPGSPKAIDQTLIPLFESIPACIDLMGGPFIETDPNVVTAFRPNHR
ncbi:MAG: molybdopterin adenylyltransferase [Candidatus Thalassarchaeaceae archaeon]|jgi:molybdopterin adenylyltransferase|nr:molybdopterin adenylyltransferase [Candidatus Thalassarchaeaceae archaeon]